MDLLNDVFLVIPCYNESSRIISFLDDLNQTFSHSNDIAILVVEDGSDEKEQTRMKEIVQSYCTRNTIFLPLLVMQRNQGKGRAVYAGWESHRNQKWLMFADADGSVNASEILRMIHHARNSSNQNRAIFAARVKMLGRNVQRLFKRHLLGRIYATLVSNLLDVPVYDSQCGAKLVPRLAYEKIATSLNVNGFAFDVDLMITLLDSGCGIEEFPVDWQEMPGGKVNLIKDSLKMLVDVLRIKKQRAHHS